MQRNGILFWVRKSQWQLEYQARCQKAKKELKLKKCQSYINKIKSIVVTDRTLAIKASSGEKQNEALQTFCNIVPSKNLFVIQPSDAKNAAKSKSLYSFITQINSKNAYAWRRNGILLQGMPMLHIIQKMNI